jgi:phage terminase large subunit
MRDEDIEIPFVFSPIFPPPSGTRYIALYGGRGSAKSHTACIYTLLEALKADREKRCFRVVCVRESQKSLDDSVKGLLESYIWRWGLSDKFIIQDKRILLPHGGKIIFNGMRDYNSYNIKSLEDFDLCWVEEADALGALSWEMLRPTIRKPGSQFLVVWNPKSSLDSVEKIFRLGEPPANSVIIQANYLDNPHFTKELEQEMLECKEKDPENFDHIWLGAYKNVVVGAYYARQLLQARSQRRVNIGIPDNHLYPVYVSCDLGLNDLFVMWVAQWIGREILFINNYAASGQTYSTHVGWLLENGYTPDRTKIFLPHDGVKRSDGWDYLVSAESLFTSSGFKAETIKNQGAGAAMMRVAKTREMFHQFHFDRKCNDGVLILGQYRPKLCRMTGRDLGPDHGSGSDYADSLGLMSIVYKPPRVHRVGEAGGALKVKRSSIA